MADLLLVLLELIIEVLGESLIEWLFELAVEAFSAALSRTPAISVIGLMILGAISGLVSGWLVPRRLIAPRFSLPGASLLLAPLITGYAMKLIGERMRRSGRRQSELVTFRGGCLFALSMALIRLWLVVLAR